MKKVSQGYIWTAKLVPNAKQSYYPWLILKRTPAPTPTSSAASKVKPPPNTLPDTPSNLTPSSVSSPSPSSASCCSSCCSCCSSSCSSSSSSCRSSSSSSSLSQRSPARSSLSAPFGQHNPTGEAETWTCEIVEGHCKIIIRRQLSERSMVRTKKARRPGAVGPTSVLQRKTKRPLRSRQACNEAGKKICEP